MSKNPPSLSACGEITFYDVTFFRLKLIEWEKRLLAKGEFSLGDLTFWTDTLILDPLYLNLAWSASLLRQARKETVSKGYLIGEAEFLAGVILVFSTPTPFGFKEFKDFHPGISFGRVYIFH